MPISILAVACEVCAQSASFEFANILKIRVKSDIPYFEKSKHFDILDRKGWGRYKVYYHAIHYPGISPALENIEDLPENCQPEEWNQGSFYPNIIHNVHFGVLRCDHCKNVLKHKLDWPKDAYFQIEYKGESLWAYDRKFAIKLINYIKSKDRKKRIDAQSSYAVQDSFLRKIPEHFQTAKARDEIVKKLEKKLRA